MTDARSIRVLVANDQEWSARSIESILVGEGYEVERAYTGTQVLSQVVANPPDFVILDLQLPDIDGMEVCRRLRQMPEVGPATPIVITTASVSGRNRPIDALTAGAWDFFGQPIDGVLLLLKIKTYLAAKDELDRARRAAAFERDSGVYTSLGLTVRAREAVAHARRRGQPIACVAFRPIVPELSDALEAAWHLDTRIATGLREAARSADAVGRAGPLTYFVLAPGTGHEGAIRMAERLANGVSERVGSHSEDPAPIRFQTGVAVLGLGEPDEDADGEALLRRAAQALAVATLPAEP